MAARRRREELSERLVATAGALERPAPSPEVVGELHHFLERTERLSDGARDLAMRFYYDVAMARHVALSALGVPAGENGFGAVPAEKAKGRVVLDLEPGESPGRLVLDGRGLLVTCLAPGMTVEWGTRVTFPGLALLLLQHAAWLERQRTARRVAAEVDLAELQLRVRQLGWSTPRELLQSLVDAGPAAIPIAREAFEDALGRYLLRFVGACDGSGSRTDLAVRAWLDALGACAVWLMVLARQGAAPEPSSVLLPLGWLDPLAALVIGAASTRWPVEVRRQVLGESSATPRDRGGPDPYMIGLAAVAGHAVDLRFLPEAVPEPDPLGAIGPDVLSATRRGIASSLEAFRDAYASAFGTVDPSLPRARFFDLVRGIAILGLGARPDWGGDLVEDPLALPPPSAVELCLPGGEPAVRPFRLIVQRLFATVPVDPIAFFWTEQELGSWARVRPVPRCRQGRFHPPFVVKGSPVRAEKVPRNAPCPCGSGKKHKHCCLGKPGSAEPG